MAVRSRFFSRKFTAALAALSLVVGGSWVYAQVNALGWSTTAASNTTVGGVSIAEGTLAANLNNGMRAIMAGVKEMLDAQGGAKTTAGTANAQTLTTGLGLSALSTGTLIGFEAGATLTNTSTTTLAIDSVAAKTVKRSDGSNLSAGDITAGGIYLVAYESGADVLILLNPTPAPATSTTASAVITDNRIVRGDGGARGVQESLIVIDDTTGTTYPSSNDSGSIGKSGNAWSDAFFADGAVINFNAGNCTVTHSSGLLTASCPFSVGTSNAVTVGSLEVGHASANTLTGSGGTLSVEGNAIRHAGQETIWVPAGAMVARTTNGCASGSMESSTNDVMTKYYACDQTTSEGVQVMVQMPKSWNLSTIVAQFVWTHPAAATFGVKWGMRCVAFANDDALDTAYGTEQEVADTGGTTSDVYISDETSATTCSNTPGAEELVSFEFYRDPADMSDNLNADAYLIGVKLHYTTNAANDS